MEETYGPQPLPAIIALLALAALLLGSALVWAQLRPVADAPVPWAVAPVPTLQPTPALAVPEPPPMLPTAPPAVYIERNEGSVTVNQTNINVDVCILARCP